MKYIAILSVAVIALIGQTEAIHVGHKHRSHSNIDDDEEDEDREIMESIKFAEKKLGTKMKTPTKLAPDGHSPISYDVESNAKAKFSTKFLDSMTDTGDAGDKDI